MSWLRISSLSLCGIGPALGLFMFGCGHGDVAEPASKRLPISFPEIDGFNKSDHSEPASNNGYEVTYSGSAVSCTIQVFQPRGEVVPEGLETEWMQRHAAGRKSELTVVGGRIRSARPLVDEVALLGKLPVLHAAAERTMRADERFPDGFKMLFHLYMFEYKQHLVVIKVFEMDGLPGLESEHRRVLEMLGALFAAEPTGDERPD